MKKIFMLVFVFLVQPAFAEEFHPEAKADLEKEKIWSSVSFNGNAATSTFRIWYDQNCSDVYSVLIDIDNFSKIHSNYEDAFAISPESFASILKEAPKDFKALKPLLTGKKISASSDNRRQGSWKRYEYVNFNFPWPLSNRWILQEVSLKNENGDYEYRYEGKISNFKKIEGWWKLKTIAEKNTGCEFYGEYTSDPGVSLPHFVARSAMRSGMKRDADENRLALEKLK